MYKINYNIFEIFTIKIIKNIKIFILKNLLLLYKMVLLTIFKY